MQVCTSLQTTTPASRHSVFKGRMPFLPPNQQSQSSEGTSVVGEILPENRRGAFQRQRVDDNTEGENEERGEDGVESAGDDVGNPTSDQWNSVADACPISHAQLLL